MTDESLLTKLIDRLRQQEALELEFKQAHGGLPKDLWPTVSAFANTNGGWIVLGIAEEGDTAVIRGVRNANTLLQQLNDLLRNPEKVSTPVCYASDVSVERLGNHELIVVRIPAASRKVRPVFVNGHPYKGTYVRRHGGDYHCTKQEVDRMMRDASEMSVDSTVLGNFDEDDIDSTTLTGYRRIFATRDPTSPWNAYDDRRFLAAIGAWGRDRERGTAGLTIAGLLLLGKQESIRDWRPRHLIDFRKLPDNAEGKRSVG
jgi:ATP-dependent DNA helicase RecG